MADYRLGKIYKLTNSVEKKIHIGSTIQSSAKRKSQHKIVQIQPVYKHCNDVGWLNIKITLIEDYLYNSSYELLKRERYCMV